VIAEELQLVGLVGWRRNKRERTCAGRKNLGRPDTQRCGSTGSAAGRIVVLAAHAIETPKLLLMSRDERTPKGVANSTDTVGRY
jgi:choline dehydrogenase-like flavoprotein